MPLQTSPTAAQRSIHLTGHLQLDLVGGIHALGGIEHFDRDEIAVLVLVEDHARLILDAFRHCDALSEDQLQRVGFPIVLGFHGCALQYFPILLVRYAVTTAAGSRSTSTKTLIK